MLACVAAGALLLGGCSGPDVEPESEDSTISVLMVGNPQMTDLQRLTAANFTARSNIKVEFTVLAENDLREAVTADVSGRSGRYDVVSVGAYEVPIWSKNGWLHELSTQAAADPTYDQADLLKPMVQSLTGDDGKMYAAPFYGESSFLMYNKAMLAAKGLTMPAKPTWSQVAGLAAKLDDKPNGVAGICLRGLPGWGELGATLTTVVNTFGGTWFEKDWTPKVSAPEFTAATQFYVDLVRKHGQPQPQNAGFAQCLDTFSQGKAAMWYDATSAAGTLEDPKVSKVAGRVGYAYAPVQKTSHSGWLWTWAWATPRTTKRPDEAWKFISWATSKDYEKLVGEKLGWSRLPSGKRTSTFALPQYQQSAKSFADMTLASIQNADPQSPGRQPRPTLGVQFVGIPEFATLGTQVSREVSDALAGTKTVKGALATSQKLAGEVAQKYR